MRGALHACTAWCTAWCVTQSALPVASHASPHASRGAASSRRAAPPRRAWQCIAWRGCRTPSARSLPRARPSSHGSRRPSTRCAAAAVAAAAARRQAHGSRLRAACRDRLRARRCMESLELLIRELPPSLATAIAGRQPGGSALCPFFFRVGGWTIMMSCSPPRPSFSRPHAQTSIKFRVVPWLYK